MNHPMPEPPEDSLSDVQEDARESSMPALGKMRRPSKKKAAEIVDNFCKHFDAAKTMKKSVEEVGIKAYRQFCSVIQENKKVAYLFKVHDPHFFATTTANVAAQASMLLGQPRLLKYRPRGMTSDLIANYFTEAFDYNWKENPRCRLDVIDMLFDRELYGNAFGVCYWNEEWRKVASWKMTSIPSPKINIDPVTGQLSMQVVEDQVKEFVTGMKKVKDHACFRPLNFFRCYPDAEARSVAEGRWFIYHERRSLTYVKEMRRTGQWFRSVCDEIIKNPSAYVDTDANDIAKILFNTNAYGTDPGIDQVDPLIDVYEYYTQEGKAVIVGRREVVSYREGHLTGYYPIIHIRNHHAPNEFWGMSSLVPIETQLVALQNMYSAQVTETILQVFRPIIVTDPAVNVDRFRYTPGAIWQAPGAQPNSIQPLMTDPSGIQHGANLCNDLRNRIDVALASGDTRRGSIPTRSTSATAVNASEANANIRLGPASIENEDSFVNQLGSQFARMIMALQSDDITTRLNGGQTVVTIKAELLNQDFELEVECVSGPSQQASELEVKRLIELGNMAMNFQVPTFNREEFIKVIAEMTAPRVGERVIMSPEQAMQQAMMAQQAAMLNPGASQTGPGAGAMNANQANGMKPTGDGPEQGNVTEASREIGGVNRVD